MNANEKAVLKRNLLFFSDAKHRTMLNQPRNVNISKQVIAQINDMIDSGEIISMLNVEAVYNYCFDKMQEENGSLENYAKEISSFLN